MVNWGISDYRVILFLTQEGHLLFGERLNLRFILSVPLAVAGLFMILLLQPSLSFVWDVLFFNRATSTLAWAGVLLALSGICLGATGGRKV